MKRRFTKIASTTQTQKPEVLFTPEEIVDLLKAIIELEGVSVSAKYPEPGSVEFIIGDMIYKVI